MHACQALCNAAVISAQVVGHAQAALQMNAWVPTVRESASASSLNQLGGMAGSYNSLQNLAKEDVEKAHMELGPKGGIPPAFHSNSAVGSDSSSVHGTTSRNQDNAIFDARSTDSHASDHVSTATLHTGAIACDVRLPMPVHISQQQMTG
jgi:hypothetical protein